MGGARDSAMAAVWVWELLARDKANLDTFWVRDESLEETTVLREPEVLAEEIVEGLESALEQLRFSEKNHVR